MLSDKETDRTLLNSPLVYIVYYVVLA